MDPSPLPPLVTRWWSCHAHRPHGLGVSYEVLLQPQEAPAPVRWRISSTDAYSARQWPNTAEDLAISYPKVVVEFMNNIAQGVTAHGDITGSDITFNNAVKLFITPWELEPFSFKIHSNIFKNYLKKVTYTPSGRIRVRVVLVVLPFVLTTQK